MADEFQTFLAALAPEERDPDRAFVARMQARVALEERLAGERRSMVRRLGLELLGLAAVAAALVSLGRAAPVVELVVESPSLALLALLSFFALLVAVLSVHPVQRSRSAGLGPWKFKDLGR